MRWLFLSLLFSFAFVRADEPSSLEKIRSHMLIGDYWSARDEAKKAIKQNPDDPDVYRSYIESLIALGDEKKLVKHWRKFEEQFGQDKQLLERVSWGIIQSGSHSSSPQVRVIASIAAYLGRDIKGVKILKLGLDDSNIFVRGVAAQLAAGYPDKAIQEALLSRLSKEQIRPIKVQVIHALGAVRASGAQEALIKIAADDNEAAEVVAAAAVGWANIVDGVPYDGLKRLATSDKAGLRLLACQLMAKNGEHLELSKVLVKDPVSSVRAAALVALGLHRQECEAPIDDLDDEVQMVAAWFSTITGKDVSQVWQKLLASESPLQRVRAAAALKATGDVELIRHHFEGHEDPYVQLNLAQGLLGLRDEKTLNKAVAFFGQSLSSQERWAKDHFAIFDAIIPDKLREGEVGLLDSETSNQLVRLEALSQLSVLDPKVAEEAILAYLTSRGWGISSTAAALLLQEGNQEMVEVIGGLLDHKNRTIQVQAALILALWGRDTLALDTLKSSYPTADRNCKERILEGMGRVGDESTLAFLDSCLSEPFPTLRLIAASSIIQTLNH